MKEGSVDRATVVAIAVLAYTLADLVHEALGHGGAALLLGARPTMLNAIFFNYDEATVSLTAQRVISAAGSVVNLVVGLPLLAIVPRVRSARWRYFLWLFAAVNVLTAFGYLLYSGIGGIGDWSRVIDGFAPTWLYRGGLIVTGFVLYFVVAPRPLDAFLGRTRELREVRARALSLVPYFVGAAALVLAGLLNPLGWRLVVISAAAASLGGTSLLAWYPALPRAPQRDTTEPPLGIARGNGWLLAATIVLLFFVFVLGPGIGSLAVGD